MLKKILKWSVVVTILSFIGVFVYVHFATYDATQEAETAIHLEYVEKTDKVLIFQAEQ